MGEYNESMKKVLIALGILAGIGLVGWVFFSVFPGLFVKLSLKSEIPSDKQAVLAVVSQDKQISEHAIDAYVNIFEHRDISFKVPGNGTYKIKRPTDFNTKIAFSTGKNVSILGPVPGESTIDDVREAAKTSMDDIGVFTPADEVLHIAKKLISKSVIFAGDAHDMYAFDTAEIKGLYFSSADSIIVNFMFKNRSEGDMSMILRGYGSKDVDFIIGSIRRKNRTTHDEGETV